LHSDKLVFDNRLSTSDSVLNFYSCHDVIKNPAQLKVF